MVAMPGPFAVESEVLGGLLINTPGRGPFKLVILTAIIFYTKAGASFGQSGPHTRTELPVAGGTNCKRYQE